MYKITSFTASHGYSSVDHYAGDLEFLCERAAENRTFKTRAGAMRGARAIVCRVKRNFVPSPWYSGGLGRGGRSRFRPK